MDQRLEDYFKDLRAVISSFEQACRLQVEAEEVAHELNENLLRQIRSKADAARCKVEREVQG